MRRTLTIGLAALAIAVGFAYLFRERLVLAYLAEKTPKTALAEREALLEPNIRYYPPTEGKAPYPAVLQFHGCSGMRADFHEQWAKVANDAGFMAVVVDSNRPRGIDRERALKTVCEGKELIGQERAGDIVAALDIARRRPDINPQKIVLAGWSHGAWTVMDFIALETAEKSPPGLRGVRAAAPDLAGLILFYPHCGPGAWTRLTGWKTAYPTLAFIAGKDSIVDPKACPPLLARIGAKDPRVETHIYPDADHSFDDPNLPDGWKHLYNAADHEDAARRYAEFLKRVRE